MASNGLKVALVLAPGLLVQLCQPWQSTPISSQSNININWFTHAVPQQSTGATTQYNYWQRPSSKAKLLRHAGARCLASQEKLQSLFPLALNGCGWERFGALITTL
ncbi:hypothetical protein BBK36DRAFT_1138306 [Trichoderma citrinoviride]|uniref:Uncharacterized protein n=1 Tax=Trichoderma citrinoviride TaxID=58853 RepID=A0A2T4BKT5_9HYPO|nr:hypothetical protein BBK36DRAFT_1138306 [Trichoderma citrinoviride]PTB69891.1 hypothetical protein BBK36DRAFT_1138306 [Trichoderma citrinoviride]